MHCIAAVQAVERYANPFEAQSAALLAAAAKAPHALAAALRTSASNASQLATTHAKASQANHEEVALEVSASWKRFENSSLVAIEAASMGGLGLIARRPLKPTMLRLRPGRRRGARRTPMRREASRLPQLEGCSRGGEGGDTKEALSEAEGIEAAEERHSVDDEASENHPY